MAKPDKKVLEELAKARIGQTLTEEQRDAVVALASAELKPKKGGSK